MFLPVTIQLLEGFWETLKVFLLTLAFSIPLGLVICFGSMSKFSPLRVLSRGLVWVIRGTPLMLQLIIIFYGPGLMFGLPSMSRMSATILAFAIIHIIGYIGKYSALELLMAVLQYLPAGLCLAWAYTKSDTIFAPILIHAAINAVGILAMR